ncbi:hypothetical protein DL546_003270 [Coniochaeta pulveracea]|uniref:Uncharacterized protein n=1 Tax=Coniochaeta pulveracea TaxID=177199 RepID=A0A420YBQ9_9PEZI|nr:hypothetical protein DL546_003270 [Coniochaeta pulveracea]
MRAPAFLLLALSSTASSLQQPFQPAQTPAPVARRQQDGCLANYYSCSSQGAAFNGICCQYGQVCSLDSSNQPACCPANAVCTGTAPTTFATPGPQSVSFVPNTYFSFPYAVTSFADAGQCSSAVSACSANYAACTSQLAGGNNNGAGGVTVVVGGSTTVAGAGQAGVTLPTASASSVCSSLSSQACMGLQAGMCTGAGVTSAGFYFGSGTGNAAPRATGVGVGMGIMGMGVGVGLGWMAGL